MTQQHTLNNQPPATDPSSPVHWEPVCNLQRSQHIKYKGAHHAREDASSLPRLGRPWLVFCEYVHTFQGTPSYTEAVDVSLSTVQVYGVTLVSARLRLGTTSSELAVHNVTRVAVEVSLGAYNQSTTATLVQ